jgi:hypothetical protein
MAGIWAAGLGVFTIGLRIALGAMTGDMHADADDLGVAADAVASSDGADDGRDALEGGV